MITVTIKGSEWLRGGNVNGTYLLNDDGQMCCLGICAIACDIEKEDILNEAAPSDLQQRKSWDNLPSSYSAAWLNADGKDSPDARDAMCINDASSIGDDERIAQLRLIFKRNGFRIRWLKDK